MEALVVCKPVRIGDVSIRHVQVGDQIQCAGSAVTPVGPVEDTDKVLFDGAQKFLTEGEVHVLKHVEHDCHRVVSVVEGS